MDDRLAHRLSGSGHFRYARCQILFLSLVRLATLWGDQTRLSKRVIEPISEKPPLIYLAFTIKQHLEID